MITVYLVEDHLLLCECFKALLASEPIISVIGSSGDGMEALTQIPTLQPNILLLDLSLPKLNGMEVLKQLPKEISVRPIILSMHSEESCVLDAFKNGARGYVSKDCSSDELLQAIRKVAADELYIDSKLRSSAFTSLFGKFQNVSKKSHQELTKREQDVLRLSAESKSNKNIGLKLSISHRTVETHRANLMKKLGLNSQTDLIRYAVRHKLIEL